MRGFCHSSSAVPGPGDVPTHLGLTLWPLQTRREPRDAASGGALPVPPRPKGQVCLPIDHSGLCNLCKLKKMAALSFSPRSEVCLSTPESGMARSCDWAGGPVTNVTQVRREILGHGTALSCCSWDLAVTTRGRSWAVPLHDGRKGPVPPLPL